MTKDIYLVARRNQKGDEWYWDAHRNDWACDAMYVVPETEESRAEIKLRQVQAHTPDVYLVRFTRIDVES